MFAPDEWNREPRRTREHGLTLINFPRRLHSWLPTIFWMLCVKIEHYQRTVSALAETRTLMAQIDSLISDHGDWPLE
jgi:hypothetical protein